ncbi:type II and III secretion system protein family protein [Asticcacaulis solisilvae]|uniref:type II and III secretion system protein family protein n=1 Tax=Asticcacaulis solisilvae TaxID=1217274 RepID=UPI003FD840FF
MSAAMLFAASAVSAAPQPYLPSPSAMRVTTQTAPVKTQVLNLAKGRSAVIDLPADASDVFVSNPAVADAVLRTPRRIFVLGVAPGQSDAIFFDGMGRQILNLSVRVEAATDNVADAVHRLFPDSHVEIQSLNGHIVLSGMARNAGEADEIARLAQTYVDKPENVLNLISIAGKDQVTLKVRIVEVNRNTIKQLGFDKSALIGQVGGVQYSLAQSPTYGVNNKLLGGVTGGYSVDTTQQPELATTCSDGSTGCYVVVHGPTDASNYKTAMSRASIGSDGLNKATAMIQAFEQVGLVRTLAEPNLTAVSGESARFLAGGEFPVPVGQDNQGRVTVEFKPFGVGLGFTPVVTSSGRISLKVSTEVSELTNVGALALNSTLTIPGLTVRRAETSVEMQSGSSLMIAGLLQSKYKQAIGSLPGLTTLPVLGTLFRSRDFLNDETEMVVIVTPYIVAPTSPNALQTPADNLDPANDLTTVFMGNLNKVIHKPVDGQAPPPAAPYQAPIGYVIE